MLSLVACQLFLRKSFAVVCVVDCKYKKYIDSKSFHKKIRQKACKKRWFLSNRKNKRLPPTKLGVPEVRGFLSISTKTNQKSAGERKPNFPHKITKQNKGRNFSKVGQKPCYFHTQGISPSRHDKRGGKYVLLINDSGWVVGRAWGHSGYGRRGEER